MKYLVVVFMLITGTCYSCEHDSVKHIVTKYRCLGCGEWVAEYQLSKRPPKLMSEEEYNKLHNIKMEVIKK